MKKIGLLFLMPLASATLYGGGKDTTSSTKFVVEGAQKSDSSETFVLSVSDETAEASNFPIGRHVPSNSVKGSYDATGNYSQDERRKLPLRLQEYLNRRLLAACERTTDPLIVLNWLRYGANPNFKNEYGYTALHILASREVDGSTKEFFNLAVKNLFEYGADPFLENSEGQTAAQVEDCRSGGSGVIRSYTDAYLAVKECSPGNADPLREYLPEYMMRQPSGANGPQQTEEQDVSSTLKNMPPTPPTLSASSNHM